MSEKMISVVVEEKKEVDVNEIWNITTVKNDTAVEETNKPVTPFQKFDQDFSAVKAFILGIEIGLAIGIVGTYVWLNRFCTCRGLRCTRPQTRRQRRRRMQRFDGDMRTNLLWTSVVNPDLETPLSFRRQLSLPDRSAPFPTYGLPGVTEAPLQIDAIRIPDRSETPPPPYHDCRINIWATSKCVAINFSHVIFFRIKSLLVEACYDVQDKITPFVVNFCSLHFDKCTSWKVWRDDF